MPAFIPPAAHPNVSFKRRNPTFLSPRAPETRAVRAAPRSCASAALSAPHTASQQTQAKEIDPSSTDALLAEINDILSTGAKLPAPVLDQMVAHLADSRGMARLGLVEAFGKVGSAALPALLSGLAHCPNPVIRRSCGKALAKIGDAAATQPLLTALVHDADTVTRSSAAGALARIGRGAVSPLLELISDPDTSMTAKGHAAWAIAFMQGDAGDALFESLQHPSRDVRIAVVSALGAVAIGDALPAMGGADDEWGDSDPGKAVLRDRAVGAMRSALADESAEVRAEAATALANAGCKEEAGRIADMLADPNPELRRCSALALMKLGDVSVAGRLWERVEDEAEVDSVRSVAKLAATSLERVEEESEWA